MFTDLRTMILPLYEPVWEAMKVTGTLSSEPTWGRIRDWSLPTTDKTYQEIDKLLTTKGFRATFRFLETLKENEEKALKQRSEAKQPITQFVVITRAVLYEALRRWAQKFHLDEDWILDDVCDWLRTWYRHPDLRNVSLWAIMESAALSPTDKWDLTFRLPKQLTSDVWNLERETAGEFKQRYLNAVRLALDDYTAEVERMLTNEGYQPIPKKRRLDHFDWLVQYQILGRSYQEIAQRYTDLDPDGERTIGTDAVRKGINTTANRIGLTLRK